MKLVELIICILGISLVSSCTDCSGNRHTPASLEPPGNLTCLVDALPPATELGMVVASTYVGTLSNGAYCVLTILAYEHSGDGLFAMQLTDADNKFTSLQGKRYTLRGNDDTTIWSCECAGGTQYYFLCSKDGNICQIPDEGTRTSCHPFVLIHKKQFLNRELCFFCKPNK